VNREEGPSLPAVLLGLQEAALGAIEAVEGHFSGAEQWHCARRQRVDRHAKCRGLIYSDVAGLLWAQVGITAELRCNLGLGTGVLFGRVVYFPPHRLARIHPTTTRIYYGILQ
jgi:hypothetical protein